MISKRKNAKSHTTASADIGQLQALAMMTGILLLAFALGAHGLNIAPVWSDELDSLVHMGAFDGPYSPLQVLQSLNLYSRDHVPLFYLLGSLWSRFAGWSQYAMRLLSCFFGLLMIAWLFRLAADAFKRHAGVVAATLMCTNAFVLTYFHELRPYTLMLLTATAHIWLFWKVASGQTRSKLNWGLLALSSACLLYSHIIGIFLVAALGISLLIVVRPSRLRLYICTSWVASLVLFSPYIYGILYGSYAHGQVQFDDTFAELFGAFLHLVTNGLEVLLLPSVSIVTYAALRKRDKSVLLFAVTALAIILLLFLSSVRLDLLAVRRMRYFLLLWIPCTILLGYVAILLPYRTFSTLLFVAIWIVSGNQFSRSEGILAYAAIRKTAFEYPPMHHYIASLQGKVVNQDFVIGFTQNSIQLNVTSKLHNRAIAQYYLGTQLGIDGIFLHASSKRYRLERDVRDILAAHPHVLLAYDPSDEPRNYAKSFEIISEEYIPCALLVDNPDLHIQRYAHPVLGCDNQATPIEFENGIRILDYAAHFDEVNERIQVLTWWEVPDESLLDQFNISLQIITSDRQNLHQIDRHLYDRLLPWNVIELATEDLPAGEYRLALILYERGSLKKVNGQAEFTGESTTLQTLLSFSIGDR